MRKILLLLFSLMPLMLVAQNADIDLLRDINHNESYARDRFWKFTTNTVTPVNIASPLITLGTGYILKDSLTIRNGWRSVGVILLNSGLNVGLKWSIRRERPFVTYPDIIKKTHAGSPSFPSGHTSSAFATATALTLTTRKWYVALPAYLWASGVGFSRMYLGVHYPSDVLGGIIVGIGSGFLAWKIDQWIHK